MENQIKKQPSRKVKCPFFNAAEKFPNNVSWRTNKENYSYNQANEYIFKNQIYLKKLELSKGSTICLYAENSIRFLGLLFAAHREQIRVTVLGDFSTNEARESAIVRSNGIFLSLDEVHLESITDFEDLSTEIDLDEEAIILFTSGSTGVEKGVVLSLNNILTSAEASNTCTHLSQNSIWLSSLTVSRIGGLAICYRTAISGAAIEFIDNLSVTTLSKIVKEGKITHLSLIPTQLQELLKDKDNISYLKSLTCILLGGAPASESLLKEIVELNIPVLTTYGMTETCSHISLASLSDPITRVYSSGKILGHTKIRFQNENGDFGDYPNFVGRLQVQGQILAKRYIDEVGVEKFLEDGWYDTGDIAFLDDIFQLNIIGRSDSMIISGGENIHLREIEIMAERLEGVISAAAIGVAHEKWGQRPVLFVESTTLKPENVKEYLKSKLNKIKIPDKVIILEKLPTISIGKIDYQVLRSNYQVNYSF